MSLRLRHLALAAFAALAPVAHAAGQEALLPPVFGGAEWIGAAPDSMPLAPDRLTAFRICFDAVVPPDGAIALEFGRDDPRLMNRHFNIYGLENSPGESGVDVRLDGSGRLDVRRRGYCPADTSDAPVATLRADGLLPAPAANAVEIAVCYGNTEISVNGRSVGRIGLNPLGQGGDYIAFPALAAFGVRAEGGALVRGLCVRNYREPRSVLCGAVGAVRSMPRLRSAFSLRPGAEVKRATLAVTARGIYELWLNGHHLELGYFNPGSTQYNRTHCYRVVDIDPSLLAADNTLTAQLSEGWWCGPSTFVGENWNFFGDRPSLAANLAIEYADGSRLEVPTQAGEWIVSTDGPLRSAGFFQGEEYDACAGDGTWLPASRVPLEGTVCAEAGDWSRICFIEDRDRPVMPFDTLVATGVSCPRPGVYVYDMGQNMAGVPLLRFRGLAPGTEISLRYGEVLYPDLPQYARNRGMVMTENLRAAMNHDIYRAAGGDAVYSPRHTMHGYRYLEITGLPEPLPVGDVRALALSSISDVNASYSCSDARVNRLWENIKWSTLSNFVSIPTDCAQRNERLGWMGDISVFSPAAVKIADVSGLLGRYLRSVRDCTDADGRFPDVAPTGFGFGGFLWGVAGITVPREHFLAYGDTALVREHYPAMRRYLDYIMEKAIDPATGIIVQSRAWGDLGDWLSPVYGRDDKSLLWECYLIRALDIMAGFADMLGEPADAARYRGLREERTDFFNRTYVDAATGMTVCSAFDTQRAGRPVDTQASYALPIAMGINRTPAFVDRFVATLTRSDTTDRGVSCPPYSLMTGFIGTAWISKALSAIGRTDLAYKLLLSDEYPSWLYPVRQGATTVWERLDSYIDGKGFGDNNSMNSFNHYSFGSVADWLLTCSAGIKAAPGPDPDNVTIAPEPDLSGGISHAEGYVEYPAGPVTSAWRVEPDRVVYTVTVPRGMTATFVPFGEAPRSLDAGCHTIVTEKPIKNISQQ